jgi:drug/metabolite transporter (DMT)-like permease
MGISLSAIFVKYSCAPSTVTAFLRLLWTVAIMTPMVFFKKETRKELKTVPKKTVLLSLLSGVFLALHFSLWFESLKHTSVSSSTTIVATEVIWVCLGYTIFLKGKLQFKVVASILITLLGSFLVAYSDYGSGNHLYGDILSLVSAVAVAIYVLIGRVVRKSTSTTVYTYIVYSTCSAVLLLTCVFQKQNPFSYSFNPIIVGLLLAVFSTILGHSIFSWCLKYFSPSFVSASKLCEPVVASVIAAFLFSELPTLTQLFGSVLILGGVFYYSMLETKKTNSN